MTTSSSSSSLRPRERQITVWPPGALSFEDLSMTKADLVEEVSRVSLLTKKDAELIVETVFQNVIRALHAGEKVELRGFGSFRLRKRESRQGRNPKTGDRVDVPPKQVPYFKPGKELKDLINQANDAPAGDVGDAPHARAASVPGLP